MTYDKNKWLTKDEFLEKDGFTFINLEGKEISTESTLENIKFVNATGKNIRIHGNYVIVQNDAELDSFDFTQEIYDYFNDLIIGKTINYAKFDRQGNLSLSINCEPKLEVKLNVDKSDTSGELWQYNYKGGFLVFS
jgi:hypothetical protein